MALRGSAMRQSRGRRFGETREHRVRLTAFGEASIQGARGRHTPVATVDAWAPLDGAVVNGGIRVAF